MPDREAARPLLQQRILSVVGNSGLAAEGPRVVALLEATAVAFQSHKPAISDGWPGGG